MKSDCTHENTNNDRQRIINDLRRRHGLTDAIAAYIAEANYKAAFVHELPPPATRVTAQSRRSA